LLISEDALEELWKYEPHLFMYLSNNYL
jgi:hypothetical protein